MQFWSDHISGLKYGLGAKMFFYEIGVLSRFRWWFTIYENVTVTAVNELQKMAWRAFKKWGGMHQQVTGEVLSSRRMYAVEDLRTTYRFSRSLAIFNGVNAADEVVRDAFVSKAEEAREAGGVEDDEAPTAQKHC